MQMPIAKRLKPADYVQLSKGLLSLQTELDHAIYAFYLIAAQSPKHEYSEHLLKAGAHADEVRAAFPELVLE